MLQRLDQDLLSYLISFLSKSDRAILVEKLKHLNQHFSKLFSSEFRINKLDNDDDNCICSESLIQVLDNLYIPTIHVDLYFMFNVVSGQDLMVEMMRILKDSSGVECLCGSDRELVLEFEFPDEKKINFNRNDGNIWKLLKSQCRHWLNTRVSLSRTFTEWKYAKNTLNPETLQEYSNRNELVLNACRLVNKFRVHILLREDNSYYYNLTNPRMPSFAAFTHHNYFKTPENSIRNMAISCLANMMAHYIIPKMDMFCNLPLDGLYSENEMAYIRSKMRLKQWNNLYNFLNIQQNIICRHMNKVFHSKNFTIVKENTDELRHKNAQDIIPLFSLVPIELLQDEHRIRLVKMFLETFFAGELNISDEYREKYISKFPDDAMHSNGIHIFDSNSTSPLVPNQDIQFTFETVQFFKKCFATIRQNSLYMAKYPSLSLDSMRHEVNEDLMYSEDTSIGAIDRICVEKCMRGVTTPILFIPCVAYWSTVAATCSCFNPYLYKDGKSTIMSCLDYDIFNHVFFSTGCYSYTLFCNGFNPLSYAEVHPWKIEDNKFRYIMSCNIL